MSRVHAILVDYISKLPKDKSEELVEILYDDACHLKKFSDNPKIANVNEMTKKFSKISKHIDNFHFPNHVDKWCQEHCNPRDVEILKGVNTPICEQLFSRFNKFTNAKAMNEPHFSIFFIYNADLHNLNLQKQLRSVANPASSFRSQLIKSHAHRLKECPLFVFLYPDEKRLIMS